MLIAINGQTINQSIQNISTDDILVEYQFTVKFMIIA